MKLNTANLKVVGMAGSVIPTILADKGLRLFLETDQEKRLWLGLETPMANPVRFKRIAINKLTRLLHESENAIFVKIERIEDTALTDIVYHFIISIPGVCKSLACVKVDSSKL